MEGLYPRTAFLLECLVFRFGLPYISIGTFCACLTPVNTFLLERFAFDSRLSIRFYWGVLRLIHACQYVSIGAFCVCFTPVSFPLSGKERRLAGGYVSIPPWVGIASSAFSNVMRLSDFVGSLRAAAFLCGDPDGVTKSAARRKCVFA